jgi:hypothetical protein
MTPSSPSIWRSIISEASAEASWCRAFARCIKSCSKSGGMSWTMIVTFSGSFERDIMKLIYIKTIEITHVFRCDMPPFPRLREHSG